MVGRIEPDGIGFQSATAVRKKPKHSRKTRKPLLALSQARMSFLRVKPTSRAAYSKRCGHSAVSTTTHEKRPPRGGRWSASDACLLHRQGDVVEHERSL